MSTQKNKKQLIEQYQQECRNQQIPLGKATKPRNQEPGMKQLLQQSPEKNITKGDYVNSWDFKSKKLFNSTDRSAAEKYNSKIKQGSQQFLSETQDQFKTLKKQPDFNYTEQIDSQTYQQIQDKDLNLNSRKPQPTYLIDNEDYNKQNLNHKSMYDKASVYDQYFSQLEIKNKQQVRMALLENQKDINGQHINKKHLQSQKKRFNGYQMANQIHKNSHNFNDCNNQLEDSLNSYSQNQEILTHQQQQQENADNFNNSENVQQDFVDEQYQNTDLQRVDNVNSAVQHSDEEFQEDNDTYQQVQHQQKSQKQKPQTSNRTLIGKEASKYIQLKKSKLPVKEENKFKETLSRYNQTKTTHDEDRKILNQCKQLRLQQAEQEYKVHTSHKQYDPERIHQYLAPEELDPKNCQPPSDIWLDKMPPAGKRKERNYYVYSVLQPDFEN